MSPDTADPEAAGVYTDPGSVDIPSNYGRIQQLQPQASSLDVMYVTGIGGHDSPLLAIFLKHLPRASSQPGCYAVLYFINALMISASFSL